MFSLHFSYNLKYLDFYFGSLFAVILVYKVASLESEHWMSKLLNAKLVQQITSFLNVSVLVYNYYYDDSKSCGARTGYWSLNYFLMMLNSNSVCSLCSWSTIIFGIYSFYIYLFHPTIIGVYRENRFSQATSDEE